MEARATEAQCTQSSPPGTYAGDRAVREVDVHGAVEMPVVELVFSADVENGEGVVAGRGDGKFVIRPAT